MQSLSRNALLPIAAGSLMSLASAQTGTLDQDNTQIANVAEALGFAPFVYEQVIEVGMTGTLEGFTVRIAEFNAAAPVLPVALYEWDVSTGLRGNLLWSGSVAPPPVSFFTNVFVDTTAASLQFDQGDYMLLQVGDATIDLFGWDLALNQGWDQANNSFVALYPHELYKDGTVFFFDRMVFQTWMVEGDLGTNYCAANANASGVPGTIRATGSATISLTDFTLIAESLPPTSFGFFITSRMQGFVQNPAGSEGNLCLGGPIGRYVGPGQILNSGGAGTFALTLDLAMMPTPTGFVAAQPGDTWSFQCWHRDIVAGVATSNFTNGLEVDFQ